MKRILVVLVVLVCASVIAARFIPIAHAQVGIGFSVASSFSTTVAGCPSSTTTGSAFLCIVVPGGTTQPSLALSVAGFNGGAPFPVVAPTSGVTSFNGRSGAVVSATGDYSYSQLSSPPTSLSGCNGSFSTSGATSGTSGSLNAQGCVIK